MKQRIITSIVAFCAFLPVLIFSETMLFPVIMALCAVIGCYEMLSCVGLKGKVVMTLPIYAAALVMPIAKRIMPEDSFSTLALAVIGVVLVYVLGVAVFQNKSVAITDVGLAFAGCFYTIAAFVGIVYLHDSIHLGRHIYLLTFICAWVTDSFAYFSGRLFGKHKLIPEVSPKKTVEGAIGGTLFCVLSTVLFGLIIVKFFNPDGSASANYLVLALSGLAISVVSQVGDLIMSLIKRHYGIKDYGKLLPGHGGILDRFDSVMAVSVILTFICTYFNLFN